jgi:hypothetical protein
MRSPLATANMHGGEPAISDKAQQHLIDAQGKWWLWPSSALNEQFGYPEPDFDLCGYAIRNLGCVSVVLEHRIILLQYRPAMTGVRARASLTSFLNGAGAAAQVIIVFYLGGWTKEFLRSGRDAAIRIGQIDLAAQSETRRTPFIMAPRRFEELLDGPRKALSEIIDLWRDSEHRLQPWAGEVVAKAVGGRGLVVAANTDGSRLIIRHCGDGFGFYQDRRFYAQAIGRDVTEQPDAAYGIWLAETYREILTEMRPQLADVDAIVRQPGGEPHRSRYRRLILPWRDTDNQPVLTVTSLLVPNIDVPLAL